MNKLGQKMCVCCESSFEKIFSLESIIKMTKDACMEKEFSAKYYGLPQKERFTLSEERNQYINMLAIALDKVEELKNINNIMETEIRFL